MRPYLLLTPGPLTTTDTVKEAMMSDWCTWDEDYNIGIVEVIRKELVELASSRPEEYTRKSHRMPKIFSACLLSIWHNSVSAASSIIS